MISLKILCIVIVLVVKKNVCDLIISKALKHIEKWVMSSRVQFCLLRAMQFTSDVLFVRHQIKVEFSMKFTSRDLSLKRTPSKKQSGVFGVKINVVTK